MARRYINSQGVEFKPLNVEIAVPLHRTAKRLAADEGWSLSRLVGVALEEFIAARGGSPEPATEGTFPDLGSSDMSDLVPEGGYRS